MHEPYIAQAIDGVLMQNTRFTFELVIANDCSPDNTDAIVKKYINHHPKGHIIKYFRHEKNLGIQANGQFAVQQCLGKYIALCEGDDYWTDPLKLQKQVDFMENNPDYSMCFHKSAIQNSTNELWKNRIYRHLRQGEYTGFDILAKWTVPTSSVFFRSSLRPVLENMILPRGILNLDIMTFLTLAEHGKLYCLGDTMSVYRIHGESVINRPDPERGKKYITHLKTLQTLFGGKYKTIIDHLIADMYVSAAWTALQRGRFSTVTRLLWGSLQISPMAIPRRCLSFIENRLHPVTNR